MRREAGPLGMHSLPGQHAWFVALCAGIPAALFALVWIAVSPGLIAASVLRDKAAGALPAFGIKREAILAEASALASGKTDTAFDPLSRALAPAFAHAQILYGTIGV